MPHKDKAEFDRVELFEIQFEDRFNRKTEIRRAVTLGESGIVEYVTVHIEHKKTKYTITEYLTKDQLTDYVLSGKEKEPKKYKTYLEAEIYVADLIGIKERKEKDKNK